VPKLFLAWNSLLLYILLNPFSTTLLVSGKVVSSLSAAQGANWPLSTISEQERSRSVIYLSCARFLQNSDPKN
jgi:hypothetical protein